MGENFVAVGEFNLKHGVRKRLDDGAFKFDYIFF